MPHLRGRRRQQTVCPGSGLGEWHPTWRGLAPGAAWASLGPWAPDVPSRALSPLRPASSPPPPPLRSSLSVLPGSHAALSTPPLVPTFSQSHVSKVKVRPRCALPSSDPSVVPRSFKMRFQVAGLRLAQAAGPSGLRRPVLAPCRPPPRLAFSSLPLGVGFGPPSSRTPSRHPDGLRSPPEQPQHGFSPTVALVTCTWSPRALWAPPETGAPDCTLKVLPLQSRQCCEAWAGVLVARKLQSPTGEGQKVKVCIWRLKQCDLAVTSSV